MDIMGYEIERKFLVNGEYKSKTFKSFRIKQGYLSLSDVSVVRVRIKDDKAFITVKSAPLEGEIKRHEWEYEIPIKDAEAMLKFCETSIIDKTRHLIKVNNHIFEVDEFYGENDGLLIAEVELQDEAEVFEKPDWLGVEVTENPKYYSSSLSIHPFKSWSNL